jgi:Ca-activated chloride channel family protein
MAERIHRHFKRLLLPRAVGARVRWPAAPSASIPGTLDAVYDGDTVHVFARFPEPPTGTATLEVTLADGRLLTQEAVLRPAPALGEADGASTLARLAAARALPALTDAREGAALAVRHQLMSPWTSYLVVAERAEGEKASELPALRPVPHMLAAGWGGTGREACVALLDAPDSYPAPSPPSARRGLPDSLEAAYLDVPAFLRRAAPPEAAPDIEWSLAEGRDRCMEPPHGDGAGPGGPLGSLVSGLNRAHPEGSRGVLAVATLADLLALGAPEQMLEALRRLLDAGHEERTVVVAFLRALAEGPAGTFLGRNARRAIAKAYKALAVDPTTLASLGAALSALLPPASGASRGGGVG